MFTQFFFIGNKLLGTASRDRTLVHSDYAPPQGYAFFCPSCAELWSRCPVEDSNGKVQQSTVWTRPCEKHGQFASDVPGSIWLSWDNDFTAAFPKEVLEREFLLQFDLLITEGEL